jgi:hypothetical protein
MALVRGLLKDCYYYFGQLTCMDDSIEGRNTHVLAKFKCLIGWP